MLLLVPEISGGLTQIATAAQLKVQGNLTDFTAVLAPNRGEEALTPVPLEIVTIARRWNLTDFSLSPRLVADRVILPRVVEGAWPIQLTRDSRHLFVGKGETLPPQCALRDGGRLVDYADCG
jgi:hypothetical protein